MSDHGVRANHEQLGGSPSDDRTADLLDAVCRQVPAVLRSAPTPPRSLRLRVGEVSVELEWPDSPGRAGPEADAPGPAANASAGVQVRSPVVGVFYRAPKPGAAPFVEVGAVVHAGDQVGIVEAMKTMIPVEAPEAGRVVEVLVADASPVEYDQPLLALDPEPAQGG
jgi:acetyl-CoA carboxylase biotin carboxyl carrier protein